MQLMTFIPLVLDIQNIFIEFTYCAMKTCMFQYIVLLKKYELHIFFININIGKAREIEMIISLVITT